MAIAWIPAGNPFLLPLQFSLICSILALCREMPSFSRSWTPGIALFTTDLIVFLPEDVPETTLPVDIRRIPPSKSPSPPAFRPILTTSKILDFEGPYAGTHTAPTAPTFPPILLPMKVPFLRTPVHTLMHLNASRTTVTLAVLASL